MRKLLNDCKKKRTIDITDKVLDAAKLDKNDYLPITQSIYLSKHIANDDLKLLEIDEENLNYLLEGNRYSTT